MPRTKAKAASAASEAWGLLQELIAAIKQGYVAVAEEFELSPPQVMALRVLDPERPLPMHELASACHLDNSTITGIVDRLEEQGLVERRSDERDRRVKMVAATDEGAKVCGKLGEILQEAPEPIARLSHKDQAALRDILRRAVEQS
jgi:MarR family transcriptional regulator, organic hydroperoxide resistance regulator